jgi:hypothetical protein
LDRYWYMRASVLSLWLSIKAPASSKEMSVTRMSIDIKVLSSGVRTDDIGGWTTSDC